MNGLYLNEDANNFFVSFPESSMNREGLEKFIRGYMHKQVGTVVLNPNAQRASYDSQVIEPIWKDVEIVSDDEIVFQGKLQKVRPTSVKWVRHTKKLHDAGLNPYCIWLEILRKEKYEGWISCRMNDVHNVFREDFFNHDSFWREHPEYRCSPFDGTWLGCCLNYQYSAVRDYKMALIEEMLELYDCDGFELDWLRFPRCLRPGYEIEYSSCVTDIVRRTRRLADEKARERRHPIRINVRIPPRPDDARRCGYDVLAWAREGLVDAVTVSNFFPTTDSDMPVELWRELLPEGIELNAGLDLWTCACPDTAMITCTSEMAAGFASEYLYRGADRIYLFNFMQGLTGMKDPGAFCNVMDSCGVKETAYRQPRRHVVTYNSVRPAGVVPDCALPRSLKSIWSPFRINVGGGTANRSAYVVTGLEQSLHPGQSISVKFNGVDCPRAENVPELDLSRLAAEAVYHKIPGNLLHDGDNVVYIFLNTGEARVVWCEIVLP